MLIYLAGPMDGVGLDEARSWREDAQSRLSAIGCGTFSPAHAYSSPYYIKEAIQDLNREAIIRSAGMLVNYGPKAFGTLREIEAARLLDKPVAVIAGDFIGPLSAHVETHDLLLSDNLVSAIAKLKHALGIE